MTLDQVGQARWTLGPAGPAGTYDVTLTARGGGGGDASATFTWATPRPGALPTPTAHLLTDYFELSVSHLKTTPKEGELTVTVTSADGRTRTVRPRQERPEGCSTPGSIAFTTPDSERDKLRDLGAPPRIYEVRLRLDGTEYRATAVTPRDEKFDGHPYVALTFDPPLPPFTG